MPNSGALLLVTYAIGPQLYQFTLDAGGLVVREEVEERVGEQGEGESPW